MSRSRDLALRVPVMAAVFLAGLPVLAAESHLEKHMEIQASIQKDPELAKLPSLRIEAIKASVPLDDRMNADDAFSGPFTTELERGMSWYLERRGLRIVPSGEDLRLKGTINHYEGWKGWGRWGVEMGMEVKLLRGHDEVLTQPLRSFFKYSDDEEVEDEVKPKYKPVKMRVDFGEILFTRVGIDLCEGLIKALKEHAASLSGGGVPASPAATSPQSPR